MATKKELEERIEQLESVVDSLKGDINSLRNRNKSWVEKQEEQFVYKFKKEALDTIMRIRREESQYLQVGDQWRDEEGNEYVLSMMPVNEGLDKGKYFVLLNKETGRRKGKIYFSIQSGRGLPFNNPTEKRTLGITDSMAKIK